MTEQQENELICEKLLGWTRFAVYLGRHKSYGWRLPSGAERLDELDFATWGEVGEILDQFEERAPIERVDSVNALSASAEQMVKLSQLLRSGRFRPADVRTAALEWIKVIST